MLGNNYLALGLNKEAETAYGKAVEFNDSDARTWYNKGYMEENLGDLQNAKISYEKFLQVAPAYLFGEQIEKAKVRINTLENKKS